ncbi:hypothetical protein ACFOHY_24740 [Rhizobium rosettiformans]|uniref:Uncharacterized protein n=1 Tax=Rhizobium rosettiformans W3 TaxID=538378 RepID=A0A4S8PKD7_9HYPH|nr:hypothetical protein FAA86_22885 [Rhizobium rosettiformans W3]
MEAVIHGLAIYFTLLVIIRLSGRRTLAQMTPFDCQAHCHFCATIETAVYRSRPELRFWRWPIRSTS